MGSRLTFCGYPTQRSRRFTSRSTERTPAETVGKIERRLGAENNRYGVRHASKLVLSADTYAYEQE